MRLLHSEALSKTTVTVKQTPIKSQSLQSEDEVKKSLAKILAEKLVDGKSGNNTNVMKDLVNATGMKMEEISNIFSSQGRSDQ